MKAIEAFLHPRRAAEEINRLAAEAERLRQSAAQVESDAAIDRMRRDEALASNEKLQQQLKQQETSTQELMKLLMKTRSELETTINDLRMQLAEARTDQEQLEDINRQVEQMVESQHAYRQRIQDLKTQLAAAREESARLAGRKSGGLPRPISMDSDPSADDTDSTGDWLMPLPR